MNDPNDITKDPILPGEIESSKKSGFKLPDGYFDQLKTQVYQQTTESRLSGLTDPGFRIPDHYFQNLASVVWSNIRSEVPDGMPADEGFNVPEHYFESVKMDTGSLRPPQISSGFRIIKSRQYLAYGIAASLLIAVCWLLITLFNPTAPDTVEGLFTDCTEEELLEYMSVYATEFSHEHLALAIGDLDINEVYIEENLGSEMEDMLIDYLQ